MILKVVSKTYGAYEVLLDDDQGWVLNHTWSLKRDSKAHIYFVTRIAGKLFKLHRLLTKATAQQVVDHANGNTLDNRLVNLRKTSRANNQANMKRHEDSSVPYKGVWFDKRYKNPWLVKICVNRKQIYLGKFDTPQQAALEYDKAAKRYFGEFAKLNFPEENT